MRESIADSVGKDSNQAPVSSWDEVQDLVRAVIRREQVCMQAAGQADPDGEKKAVYALPEELSDETWAHEVEQARERLALQIDDITKNREGLVDKIQLRNEELGDMEEQCQTLEEDIENCQSQLAVLQ